MFLIVLQEVERLSVGTVVDAGVGNGIGSLGVRERDMLAPRYFLPAVWGQDRDMLSADTNTEGENAGKGDGRGSEKAFKAPFSVESYTANTIHNLTRSLMDIEDRLDEERLASSPRTQALTPAFERTYPWSDDPVEREKGDEKVEWEGGELGFKEWFLTDGDEDGVGNFGVLWDWVAVEGRKGRMDLKCVECEREWVLSVRERGLTI